MDGLVDVSDLLGPGIYVLSRRGRVVFVGKAKSVLAMVAKHREFAKNSMPEWFPVPGVVFDQIEWKPSHPDRIDAELNYLRELHSETLRQRVLSEVA